MEYQKFADKIVCDDHENIRHQFDEDVVHMQQRDENEHNSHLHQQGKDAASEKENDFLEDPFFFQAFAFKNEELVGYKGKKHRADPGEHHRKLHVPLEKSCKDGIGKQIDESGAPAEHKIENIAFVTFPEKDNSFFQNRKHLLSCVGVPKSP